MMKRFVRLGLVFSLAVLNLSYSAQAGEIFESHPCKICTDCTNPNGGTSACCPDVEGGGYTRCTPGTGGCSVSPTGC